MVEHFVQKGTDGQSVFITDVRNYISKLKHRETINCILFLADGVRKKHFEICLPALSNPKKAEVEFIQSYIEAEIYNTLTTLGGARLEVFFDTGNIILSDLLTRAIASFDLEKSRSLRSGYGRLINVLDRMLEALCPDNCDGAISGFTIQFRDSSDFPGVTDDLRFRGQPQTFFADVTQDLDGRSICGLDIGGTDIKAALAVDGKLTALKEYDWNPAAYANVEEITDPIFVITQLMRCRASLHSTQTHLGEIVAGAMAKGATCKDMEQAVSYAEDMLGDQLKSFHAVGLCFPDVVIRNKVVGGEVPKTIGMRLNADRDFEAQFSLLTNLDDRLRELCKPGGAVMIINDGPMAAFTAAVELTSSSESTQVASGVFAHSLGTDLGTGLVLADGGVPEIPLEVYNLIVDLGSFPAKRLPAKDVRSLNNTNTGLPGTLQRFTSQTGAFRLAAEYFAGCRRDIMGQLRADGFLRTEPGAENGLLYVPEKPEDMRKPFLAHLMALAERGHDEDAANIFREIGKFLSVVWEETEHILKTGLQKRFLFGRLIKVQRAFELMREGAAERTPELELIAADNEIAFTPLMRQLAADEEFTVAQFGQAVGAIYFGNSSLQ